MPKTAKKHVITSVSLKHEELAQVMWLANKLERSASWVIREAMKFNFTVLCEKNGVQPRTFLSAQEAQAYIKTYTDNKRTGANLSDELD